MSLPALKGTSRDEARKPLAKLFMGYDEPWMGARPTDEHSARARQALIDGKVDAYLDALEGVPAWAIDKARLDFIQGRIDRPRRDKLPTAEMVAAVARAHVRDEAADRARKSRIAQQQREASEFAAKQEWLKSREGIAHQEQRAARAAEIIKRSLEK